MRAVFVFPAFLAARNLSPTSCGLFAFKLVFSHYRNLLGQLEFPFSLASVWKLRFLLEGPSCLPPSSWQWDVVTYSHRGDQIAWESHPNPRQAWRVPPRRRWGLRGRLEDTGPAIAGRRPWGGSASASRPHFLIYSKNIDRLSLMLGAWNAEINKTHLLPPRSSLSSKGEGKAK